MGIVFGWRMVPDEAVSDHVDDAGDDAMVIDRGHAADLVREQRLNAVELSLGEPELVVGHDACPIFGGLVPHVPTPRNPLYGS